MRYVVRHRLGFVVFLLLIASCSNERGGTTTCGDGKVSDNASCDGICPTACIHGDGCCPEGCDAATDYDCAQCQAATEPADLKVSLPADDAPHGEDLEWWYWTGHLKDDDGRWYGFHLVFFLAKYGSLWGQVVHHAITDIDDQSFHHLAESTLGRPQQTENSFKLSVAGLSASGKDGLDTLSAKVDDYAIDLSLESLKSPVFQHANGYTDYPFGGYTYYYSRERMGTIGTLQKGDQKLNVSGLTWFDHQWGSLTSATQLGWDWFAVQLDDGRELMLFLIRDGTSIVYSGGTYNDATCGFEDIAPDAFTVQTTGEWASPHTPDCIYPMGWTISVEGMTLDVVPVLEDQELYNAVPYKYWEGAATVSGDATGRAYIEMTGYCP